MSKAFRRSINTPIECFRLFKVVVFSYTSFRSASVVEIVSLKPY